MTTVGLWAGPVRATAAQGTADPAKLTPAAAAATGRLSAARTLEPDFRRFEAVMPTAVTRGNHAVVGAIVGGIAGIVVGAVLGSQIRTNCEANCGGVSIAAAAVGAVVGGGAGALIGWAIPKH